MCGLNGFFNAHSIIPMQSVIEQMNFSIQHRGPDAGGFWLDSLLGLAFGHRRLAVQELSSAGNQPMISECGRYVLVLNGEIYNHQSLRKQLAESGLVINWRGHSDTETLLACFVAWGIEKTLQATIGMFAIAVWDKQEQVLTLARDRMGEKPLYWGWSNDLLIFASELKSIKAHPEFEAVIDRDALTLLLRHCYIPAPYSIYKGIQKLMPGHVLQIPLQGDLSQSKAATPKPYWSLNNVVEQGLANPFVGSPEAAVDALEEQLKKSVADQMLADVPLGAFLSGGVDSSTIVALMQAQSDMPVRTFTLGFNEPGYNEAEHAKAVAKHLGTAHTELYVQPDDALSVIPNLANMYCEPFADSSQIPTFLVSQLAKQHVSVALSGDAGDELFGGYNRYVAAQKVWGPVQKMPSFVRHLAAGGLRSLSPNSWDKLFEFAKPVLPKKLQLSIPGEKARKLSEVLTLSSGEAFYRQLTSHWTDPASVVINGQEPITLLTDPSAWPKTDCLEHAMMAMDAQTYMSDDILVKVDRAAMASSLETRTPMLDHRVVELAWKMPLEYKIRNGQGKWVLRQVLYKYVPKDLIERPKAGFGIPLASWLRGPLREWAEALLDEKRLRQEGYFHPAPIRTMWLEHLSGKKNWQYHLWNILMFQAWLENQ
ncbi:asparagine synthase (glutamine-hydrolyzing) [Denitrificimonas sp. JX-1]|uniref:asparagine synthase (glutamine-hydrolyzing) n=1 Tax=Denitrificimonas halotolerans TaxID=3098930 RepID=A0ABU5GQZ3_9GAMM|nr:asparagine synthase (glutamine-hydrolyzing) [Denitrificimonas sp. JX-1]MDY7219410.1 asparagine synthase (glutamine-hydrolyzing) [Denitrificimonas sp. JX-1]